MTLRSGRAISVLAALLAVSVIAAACGGDDDDSAAEPPEGVVMATDQTTTEATDEAPAEAAPFELTSAAFAEGGELPVEITCDGAGTSPPVEWTGVPEGAESLGLVLQDPDAPGGTFVHATIYEIPVDEMGIAAAARPPGIVGPNDFGEMAYGPPCPPEGDEPHRYVFSLHAFSASPVFSATASPSEVVAAIEGASIGSAELTGTYGR